MKFIVEIPTCCGVATFPVPMAQTREGEYEMGSAGGKPGSYAITTFSRFPNSFRKADNCRSSTS